MSTHIELDFKASVDLRKYPLNLREVQSKYVALAEMKSKHYEVLEHQLLLLGRNRNKQYLRLFIIEDWSEQLSRTKVNVLNNICILHSSHSNKLSSNLSVIYKAQHRLSAIAMRQVLDLSVLEDSLLTFIQLFFRACLFAIKTRSFYPFLWFSKRREAYALIKQQLLCVKDLTEICQKMNIIQVVSLLSTLKPKEMVEIPRRRLKEIKTMVNMFKLSLEEQNQVRLKPQLDKLIMSLNEAYTLAIHQGAINSVSKTDVYRFFKLKPTSRNIENTSELSELCIFDRQIRFKT